VSGPQAADITAPAAIRRDLLLAMHHVPLDFEPAAVRAVLACMTPDAARIMWASKTFKVLRNLQCLKSIVSSSAL
jgi:hypothetical protein